MVNVEQGSDFDIGVSCRVKDQARIEIHEMRVKTQEGWRVICFRLYCVEQSRKAFAFHGVSARSWKVVVSG